MKCPYCSSEIPDNSGFCPACGNPVNGNIRQYSANTQPQSAEKGNKTGLIIAIIAICVVFVLGAVSLAMHFLVIDKLSGQVDDNVSAMLDEIEDYNFTEDIQESIEDNDSDISLSGRFQTLEDFVNSDILQAQLEQQMETLEGTGLSAEVTADGNKLIYSFTIENESLSSLMDKNFLESGLDEQEDMYKGIAAMLPAAVDVEDPVVVVRYLDCDGNEITSREFPAE